MTQDEIAVLAKAVLAAHEALDIDMGDGEATYQCCNSVCAHAPECLIKKALPLAVRATTLTAEDVAWMNFSRRVGGYQPPIPVRSADDYGWASPQHPEDPK